MKSGRSQTSTLSDWVAHACPRMRLRPEEKKDSAFLRELYGHERADELAPVSFTAYQRAAFLDQQFSLQTSHYDRQQGCERWIILDDRARPIGRLYIDTSASSWRLLEIGLIATRQHEGLGTSLLQAIHSFAGRQGAKEILLHVVRSNRGAEALYRRLGYVEIACEHVMHRRMRLDPSQPA